MTDQINWQIRRFDEFNTKEFHDLIQLRIEVFVVEQDCPYQDVDGLDIDAWHVTGTDGSGKMVACSRVLAPGVSYDHAAIGRVITKKEIRGKKWGVELMKRTIDFTLKKFPDNNIKISAQEYLIKFYNDLGFEVVGKGYLEDDIPHIGMIYTRE